VQPVKAVLAYKLNDAGFAVNGIAAASDTSALVPVVTSLAIGGVYSAGNTPANGHLRKIAFYPSRLTNAQLQALTR
jgi:hypothetical protein